MPPTSDGDGKRTVGCSLSKLIITDAHLQKIRDAVLSTHKATLLVSELLNIYIRHSLESNSMVDLSHVFNQSWILNAYNEVTTGSRSVKVLPELRQVRDAFMPSFDPPSRLGIQQCLLYDAGNMATVAATNVWMHFGKRVYSHVRRVFSLNESEYNALTKDEKRKRKLDHLQIAGDLCKSSSETFQSNSKYHSWIVRERERLQITEAFGSDNGKPFTYHLKRRPHKFLFAMYVMSLEKEMDGGKSFAIYPLRRTLVPRHVRFDQKALRDLLGLGQSDYIKQRQKDRLKRKRDGEEKVVVPKRTKHEMEEENMELFGQVVNLRYAGVSRRHLFDYAFTTDGVGARVQMRDISRKNGGNVTSLPKRGVWAIDTIKHLSRIDDLHVIGMDPGKRELIVGVDMDHPKDSTPIRYTQRQRRHELQCKRFSNEIDSITDPVIKTMEQEMAGYNSRSAKLTSFCEYCGKRHEHLDTLLSHYAQLIFRHHRWKKSIKMQQSEERLYKSIQKKKTDHRPIVLAYGAWGLIAGRPGMVSNRGNPPCIGVGLMKKLSKRFLVCPTPEHGTSKTCCRCMGPCGPWTDVEKSEGRTIRGLRRCTQRDCMIPLNRDRCGGTNIGFNFVRLMNDKSPIRTMTDEEVSLHQASLCIECD